MSDKVINISDAKKEKQEPEEISAFDYIKMIAEKNQANQDRLKKERDKANKSVLRSYKIKT